MSTDSNQGRINIFTFIYYFFLYLVLTFFLSIVTSGGWSILVFIIYGGAAYLFLLLVTLALAFQIGYKHDRELVKIPIWFALVVVYFQVFLLLFNVGGCGDSPVSIGNFVQRLAAGFPPCYEVDIPNLISYNTVMIGFFVNYFLLFAFVITTISTARKKNYS